MPEDYDIKDFPEGRFLITFNSIYQYQQKYPVPIKNLNAKISNLQFCGGVNTKLITHEKKLFYRSSLNISSKYLLYTINYKYV